MQLSPRLSGWLGLLAAILVGTGEFLLHFDPLARYSSSGYEFMAQIPEWRLTLGHFFAVVGIPFYFVGAWHIYLMLRPAGPKLAATALVTTCYGFMFGAVWMGSRASIGSLMHHPDLLDQTQLIQLYELRYETLLQVIRFTTLLLSVIYVYLVLTGRSRYPRWMAIVNPITLILACFLVFLVSKDVGKYVMPIALNVAFTTLFACSLLFGDTTTAAPPDGKR